MQAQFFRIGVPVPPHNPDFRLTVGGLPRARPGETSNLRWCGSPYPNNPPAARSGLETCARIVCRPPRAGGDRQSDYRPFRHSFLPRLAAETWSSMRTVSRSAWRGCAWVTGGRRMDTRVRQRFCAVQHQRARRRSPSSCSRTRPSSTRHLSSRGEPTHGGARRIGGWLHIAAAAVICVRIEGGPGCRQGGVQAMKKGGVPVKNFSGGHRMLDNCLRLTIGSPEENRAMLAALQSTLLGEQGPQGGGSHDMRSAEIVHNTNETRIRVRIDLDGTGRVSPPACLSGTCSTGWRATASIDLSRRRGDLISTPTTTVEDAGILLGQAFARAVGDKEGEAPLCMPYNCRSTGAFARGDRPVRAPRTRIPTSTSLAR